jgi:hypothetical protein
LARSGNRANRPVERHRLVVDVDLAGEFGVDLDDIVLAADLHAIAEIGEGALQRLGFSECPRRSTAPERRSSSG